MKERPIIFSEEMVLAILAGKKTQTRRIIKPQPVYFPKDATSVLWADPHLIGEKAFHVMGKGGKFIGSWRGKSKYGKPGDFLWVRENLRLKLYTYREHDGRNELPTMALYEAGGGVPFEWHGKTGREIIPSIHMPRSASRITLRITNVRLERLQAITDADALQEGVSRTNTSLSGYAKERFKRLWLNIHGLGSWDSNPWVWVIEFERIDNEK